MFAVSTRFAGVLFDKDGTLIDFDLTWGPAVYTMIHTFAAGNRALIEAQAEALHFSIEASRFLASSPLIAGSTADYAKRWADALGRTDYAVLKAEIDALSATESLKALTPIANPQAVFLKLSAMGFSLGVATNNSEKSAQRQIEALGLSPYVDFVAGYNSGHGGKPEPGMVLAFAECLGVRGLRNRRGRRFAARSGRREGGRRNGGRGPFRTGSEEGARTLRRLCDRAHRRPARLVGPNRS